jgi:hypothetical protein
MSSAAASCAGRVLSRGIGNKSECLLKSGTWRQRSYRQSGNIPLSSQLHTYAGRLSLEDRRSREDDDKYRLQSLPINSSLQIAHYHSSPPNERVVAVILGLGALSAGSYAASNAVTAYKEWKASIPEEPEEPPIEEVKGSGKDQETQQQGRTGQKKEESEERGENIFSQWFGVGVGSKYYEGGFEETMTRREAALILGVRESSSPARIKVRWSVSRSS